MFSYSLLMIRLFYGILFLVVVIVPSLSAADQGLTLLTATTNGDTQEYSTSLQILILMTALSFIPAALLMMTSFTRIIIVLTILRQALGLQQTPPNQVLIGITLALTVLIMSPIYETIYVQAINPYLEEKLTLMDALSNASVPIKNFLLRQTRETDLELFFQISNTTSPSQLSETPLNIAIPAFITSELKTAFQIGFIIYIPFLVIDLVIASILMAMGMIMLSPQMISLPFKLMLFVLVDGWAMTMGTMASSFF